MSHTHSNVYRSTQNMETLKKIDFRDFPLDNNAAQIEGKLYISDNFSADQPPRRSRITNMSAPVQLGMTVIIICLDGEMKLNINLNEYTVGRHMIATLLTGSFIQVTNVSPDYRGALIAIANDFMNFSEDVKMSMAIHQRTVEMPCFTIEDNELEETLKVYQMMRNKLSDKSFIYRTQVARAYLDILKYNGFQTFYTKNRTDDRPVGYSRKHELLDKFIHAVQQNYRKERQVIFYANLLCISPKYLSSVIHELSGKFASQWIDEYVVLAAKAMLRNSGHSIKEVCVQLNFSNQSMFAKYFKQHTGMTPKEYRNKE